MSQNQPATCETIADYELYTIGSTPCPRPEADTLPDWVHLKSQAEQVAQVWEKFSWLGRLVKTGTSWVSPQDIQRVNVTSTDSAGVVEQVKRLDKQSDWLKVVVADSLYGNQHFLVVFLVVTTVRWCGYAVICVCTKALCLNRLNQGVVPAFMGQHLPTRTADRSLIITLAG